MEPAESVSINKTIVMASGLSAPKRAVRYTVRDGDGRSVETLNPAGGPNSSPLAVTGKSVEPCPFRAGLMQAGEQLVFADSGREGIGGMIVGNSPSRYSRTL